MTDDYPLTDDYPRIEDLTYRVQMGEGQVLAETATLEGELTDFRFKLAKKTATFYPLKRFVTESEARAVLDPQLKAWEIDGVLRHGRGAMRFKFLTSFVQPEAPRPGVINLRGNAMVLLGGTMTATVTHTKHPAPPPGFAVDECVETLAELYLLARETPRTLLYVAYSMTTCIEQYYSGLAEAATRLGISKGVFDKINELANARGVRAEVRKFDTRVQRAPLSPDEREWLMTTLEMIVRRAGTAVAGAPVGEQVTLGTLPVLAAS